MLSSGSPLYDGIIGALSVLMFGLLWGIFKFIVYLFKNRISILEKCKTLFKRITNNSMNTTNKTDNHVESITTQDTETTTVFTENHGLFCKKCGKAVEIDAVYCKYCGAKLEGISYFRIAGGIMPTKETLKKILRCLLKWILIAGVCMLFGMSYCLLWEELGYEIVDQNLSYIEGYSYYVLPPFVAYCVYSYMSNHYSLHKKTKLLLAISLTFIVTSLIAWITWDCVEREKREYERYKINRTFLYCTFGDSMLEVQKKLEASYRHYEFYNSSFGKSIRMTNVSYGAYKIDTLCFNFHNDSFFRTYMNFSDLTEEDINNDLTYYDLRDMLWEKYRGAISRFFDDQTEITIDRYFDEDHYGHRTNYRVVLVYYDKQAQEAVDYKEKKAKEQGF